MENKPRKTWWGPFYYDPNDKRFTLPKRFGTGYTVNYGHIATKVILVLTVAAGVAFWWWRQH